MKSKSVIKGAYVAAAAVICAISLLGMVPPIRKGLIQYIADSYMHRSLNMGYWMQQLFALSFLAFTLNLLVFLAVMTEAGRKLWRELLGELKEKALSIYADRRQILIFFALFCFALLTVFRANYYYGGADDLFRAMTGERAWRNFYRYISHFMSIFIHTSPKIFDIAPLTQLMALLVMATVTVMLIRITGAGNAGGTSGAGGTGEVGRAGGTDGATEFSGAGAPGGRISPLMYLAGLPVCIYPYFLDNLSYRYDSPYMALSVFFSVLPFLFTHRLRYFAPISLASLFLMCLSYQAASGVYIVVCAFCVFKMWCLDKLEPKGIALFILTAIACYLLALVLFFGLFNVQPTGTSYVDKNVDLSALAKNTQSYLWQLSYDMGRSTIKLAGIILLPVFIASSCLVSRRTRIQTVPVALLLIAFCTVFSAGAFLVMGRPLWEPRSKFSFGILVGLVSICCTAWTAGRSSGGTGQTADGGTKQSGGTGQPTNAGQSGDDAAQFDRGQTYQPSGATVRQKPLYRCRPLTYCSRAAVLLLAYSCVTFAFAMGNVQASQKKYTEFRMSLLVEDLAHIVRADQDDIHIHTLNTIEPTKIVKTLAATYPVILHMVDNMGGHGLIFALQDYGFGTRATANKYSTPKPTLDGLELVADCQFHSIYEDYEDVNSFYILFKEPSITLRE